MHLPSPRRLYQAVATAEAVTWTLLLVGMFLKYVTKTTELGVRVGGMLHGVVFIAYVLTVLAVWVDQRWSARRAAVALLAAIPPLATLWAERRIAPDLGDRWRLLGSDPGSGTLSAPERLLAAVLQRPVVALALALAAVAALTALALAVGPPVGG